MHELLQHILYNFDQLYVPLTLALMEALEVLMCHHRFWKPLLMLFRNRVSGSLSLILSLLSVGSLDSPGFFFHKIHFFHYGSLVLKNSLLLLGQFLCLSLASLLSLGLLHYFHRFPCFSIFTKGSPTEIHSGGIWALPK